MLIGARAGRICRGRGKARTENGALVCCHGFRGHKAVASELKSALNEFVRFAQTLRGDEKSEAQTFLDHFFRALGHEGVIEAGGTFEFRVNAA